MYHLRGPRRPYRPRRGGGDGLLSLPVCSPGGVAGAAQHDGGSGGNPLKFSREEGAEMEVTTKTLPPGAGPALLSDYVTLAQLQERRRLKLERQRKEEGVLAAAAAETEARLRKQPEKEEQLLLRALKEEDQCEDAPRLVSEEAAIVRDRGVGRSGLTQWHPKNRAPVSGVVGAGVLEKRRLDGGDSAIAEAVEAERRPRKNLDEEERVRLRAPKEEDRCEKAPRPIRDGAPLGRDHGGPRLGPSLWRRTNSGAPMSGVVSAGDLERRRPDEGHGADGRGEAIERRNGKQGISRKTKQRWRRSKLTGSVRMESEPMASGSASASSAGDAVDLQNHSETVGSEDVIPRPIDLAECENLHLYQNERVDAAEEEVEKREGNMYPVSLHNGQDGSRVTRLYNQSSVRKVDIQATPSEPLQPDKGIVCVASKLRVMSINMPGADKMAVGGRNGVDRGGRRATLGTRGRYPSFRRDGGTSHCGRSRSAGEKSMWVKKTECNGLKLTEAEDL